jgi:hypothetical protein
VHEYGLLGSIYHCTLATSTLIVLFSDMLKFSKKNKKLQEFFLVKEDIKIFGIFYFANWWVLQCNF